MSAQEEGGLPFQKPCDALLHAARIHPDRPFLRVLPETAGIYGIEARSHTYAQTAERVEALKHWYEAAGIGHGHRVGLMLQNRPGFFFNWLALNALGASVVPLSTEWRATELEYVVGHSELCMAVVQPNRVAELEAAAESLSRSVSVTTERELEEGAAGRHRRVTEAAARIAGVPDIHTECALLYTSGTTGRPKGCILPNEYFIQAGHWYATIGGACTVRPGEERMLTPLPTAHMNAMACSTMCMLMTGGCLIALDRFHASTWWQSVRESQATIVHYLGVMPAMLMSAPPLPSDQDHQVRFGFGAGVNPKLHAPFEERFGFPLLEAWAMTETGSGAVVIANRESRHVGTACFGRAEHRVEYRLVDDEGKDVPVGVPGELLVRGRGANPRFGFFAGYLKDAAATDESWRGGFFHTGDVVRADAEGNLFFVDRKKNVIRRSGENISAVEVESALIRHPGVRSVGVAAVPDAIRGDEVLACVVLKDAPGEGGHRATAQGGVASPQASSSVHEALAQELVRFALSQIAYFKVPRYVVFCDALPLTATEKIQRAELRALAVKSLEAGDAIDTRALKKRDVAA